MPKMQNILSTIGILVVVGMFFHYMIVRTEAELYSIDRYLTHCEKIEVICPDEQEGFGTFYDAEDYKVIEVK